jgi:prepilin-type N-terminal cleavage/methylation domain-containing protein
MTSASRDSSNAGFTLLEVVLALTIFALMGAILYGALALGQKAVERSHLSFEKNQKLRAFADLMGSYVRSSHPYRATPQIRRSITRARRNNCLLSRRLRSLWAGGMALVRVSWQSERGGEGL